MRGPFWLSEEPVFPPVELAAPDGLLALGGDLSPERLLRAYSEGIFPWPLGAAGTPLLWFSPDPRFLLYPEELHVSRSLRRSLRTAPFQVRVDTAFEEVIRGCAAVPREGQGDTWIDDDMIAAYTRLHRLGHAHSFESWDGTELAGGIYGVACGRAFFAESMFYRAPEASKIALVALVRCLGSRGYCFIDCQQETENLARFGARRVPRSDFILQLKEVRGLAPNLPAPGLLV